jgi:hypothetical protein
MFCGQCSAGRKPLHVHNFEPILKLGASLSWALFIDESGQDQRNSPYEVLAGIAIEDRQIWPLIRQLSDAQAAIFGMRLFQAYGNEAKAQKLLKRKVFQHAAQMGPIDPVIRTQLAREILEDGTNVTRERLTALAQAKLAYCNRALALCRSYGGRAFASIVPQTAPRPETNMLRKDYAYLFERFYYFLNGQADLPMGYLVSTRLKRVPAKSFSTKLANISSARRMVESDLD